MSEYHVQVRAKNNMGASGWSNPGSGRTAGLVVQITSDGNVTSGENAVFTDHPYLKPEPRPSPSISRTPGPEGTGTPRPERSTSRTRRQRRTRCPPCSGEATGRTGGSVTVSITADTAYAVGTDARAVVNITQHPNNPPNLREPSNRDAGTSYKFPAGRTGGMRYGSEPATDQDGDDLSYLITFTNPETGARETVTVPEDATAAALTGTLMNVKRMENDFIFEPDGTVTPGRFVATYNEPWNAGDGKPLDLVLQATDGRERSEPVHFSLGLYYDPSGYFPEPAEIRSMSRWELPQTIETPEGAGALSEATVQWTSPFAGARSWGAGDPAGPVICRQGLEDEEDQEWPAAAAEDSGLFTVTPASTVERSGGAVFSFTNPPDFEKPSDANGDNIYRLRIHNVHTLHVAGEQNDFPACSGSAVDITVTVTNVNEPPAFAGETATRTIAENTPAGQPIGSPVEAGDPDAGEILTYSLAGTDGASFGITPSTGQLQTKTSLDFEDRASYEVTVSVHDGRDAAGSNDTTADDSITVTITVTGVDEPPVVTGPSSMDYAENGTGTLAAYTAGDPEGVTSIDWTMSGADSGKFSISATGEITFRTPPDYENRRTPTGTTHTR